MLTLTIRTDKPEAEIGLLEGDRQVEYITWEAHRQLAETIHGKIETLLKSQNKTWQDIQGIVCFRGPGSFTGLRIGLTVGNAIAYSLNIPIVSEIGNKWAQKGLKRLNNNEDDKVTIPEYGSPANITLPQK